MPATAQNGVALDPSDTAGIADHYRDLGWVVVRDVFTGPEVDEIARLAVDIGYRELMARLDPRLTVTVDTDGRAVAPRKVDWAFPKAPQFRAFVLDPRLNRLVDLLLGQPGYLARDHVFLKPPRIGSSKPLHQDHTHFLCEPASHAVTAWVALDEGNGCLRYVDRSHLGAALPHEPVPGGEHYWVPVAGSLGPARSRFESLAVMRRGSVAFHHPLTLHGSAANRSERWRRAHSSQWVTAEARCTGDLLEWACSRTVGAGRHPVDCP